MKIKQSANNHIKHAQIKERAMKHLKRNRRMTLPMKAACVMVSLNFMFSPLAGAGVLPTGPDVVHGAVNINSAGNVMNVNQATNKAIVNWESFSIGAGYGVNINQPSAQAAMLSRVVGADPSRILGALRANGIFYLINPHGVFFGPNATVDVAQLIASTLNIDNEAFLTGKLTFAGTSEAAVENQGRINAGAAALIAKNVTNAGSITARNAALAAATNVNLGTIAGGKISVDVSGLLGDAINTGVMDASGDTGGRIVAKGDRVGQFGEMHADGVTGAGGDIRLDAQSTVALSSDSLTTANAGLQGDGGVTAFSPDTALFRQGARIEALGGELAGDGGFIEVSGLDHVEVFGNVNASAANGLAGTFLIDPTDITITDAVQDITDDGDGTFTANANTNTITDDTIEGYLNAGTSVTLDTSDADVGGPYAGSGDIIQNADAGIGKTAGGNATLTLIAEQNIQLNGGITSSSNQLSVDLQATGTVDINAAITTNGGTFDSTGTDFDNTGGTITTGGGNVLIDQKGAVTVGATIDAGSGTLTIHVDNDNSGATAGTFAALTAGAITVDGTNSDDTLTFNGLVTSSTGAVTIDTADTIDINAGISAATTLDVNTATTVNAATGSTIQTTNGALDIQTGVTTLNITGVDGTLLTIDGNGDASVLLAAITDTNNPNLTVNSEGGVNLTSVSMGTGTLTVHTDDDGDGIDTGTFG
ncbi:MAG: filamentous hemagglutinin N-terminal domain-containing protein, partial [Kiritimatiellaeota bacterium]|nr:filamentous hemagglutinin N-terminal domain-containing protein [Kiritimatiellota bacterium]